MALEIKKSIKKLSRLPDVILSIRKTHQSNGTNILTDRLRASGGVSPVQHLIRPALLIGISALCLTGCMTGEGVSFATRVDGASQASFEETSTEAASDDDAGRTDSGFMATSGNAILPGGVLNPALAGLGGAGSGSGSGLFGQDPGLNGNGLIALAGLNANLELSGPNGPGLTVTPTAGLVAGANQTPLAPVVSAANGLTGGATGSLLGGTGALAPGLSLGGGSTPSVAGQPVTLLAGSTPVLGGAASSSSAVVNTVSPVTSTLVNSVVGATAPASTPSPGGTPSPSGLGGLAVLIPPLRLP